MASVMNTIKAHKMMALVIAILVSIVFSSVVHAVTCSGYFDVVVDVNGFYFHQHYALNAWGYKVATYYHY